MRYLLLLCMCAFPYLLQAQTNRQPVQAPYLQHKIIPPYKLTLPDGHTITKDDLRKNITTLVFIFSVECDHCKQLTEEMLKNMDKLKKTQILMITPFKPEQMKEYYDQYKIVNYPNIIMASEPTRQIMYFYDMHYFPGLYVYNRKQSLVKGFEGTTKLDQVLPYIN